MNKNFSCLWQEKLMSPRVFSNPRILSLKFSDLFSTPQRIAAEKGKILCLYITRRPMISLYLLNYCYDSLSQIPTLLRISDRRKSWGAFISKPLRSRALDAHLYSSSDRGRSTPICTGNLRQNYWQQWLNEKNFALLFVGWSNVMKMNIAESSLKF